MNSAASVPQQSKKHEDHIYGGPLTENDYQMLHGIPRTLAEQARLRRVTSAEGRDIVGRKDSRGDYSGVVFPYTWPGNDHIRDYRLRRDHPDLEKGSDGKVKPKGKYLSAPGRSNLLYWPPAVDPAWLDDPAIPVVITEGEKKTLSLWDLAWHRLGDSAMTPRFLPIGLSGVFNFRGKIGIETAADGTRETVKGVISDLERIPWQKREVIILFDSNVHSNESVRIARWQLRRELHQRGASVKFADIPAELGLNGIDDVAGKLGVEHALGIVAAAYDPKKEKVSESEFKVDIEQIPDVRTLANEDLQFVVPQLFPVNTITVVSAESEAGKTTFLLWLSKAISTGGEFLGAPCEQHPVLYLSLENPVEYIADITRRFDIANGTDANLKIWGDWLEDIPPSPGHPHVVHWIAACDVAPFIVVDSLIAFFDGDNENDAVQMRRFISVHGRAPLHAGACGVVFLTHPGKAETAKIYRGSSDLKPAIDTGYVLRNVSQTGLLEKLVLGGFKVRFKHQKRDLVLHYAEADGKATFKVIDDKTQADKEKEAKDLDKINKIIQSVPGISQNQIAKASGIRKERVCELLSQQINVLWTVQAGKRQSLCYYPHSTCSQ